MKEKIHLCFATNNSNKVNEINQILGDRIVLKTLREIGCTEEIQEPFDTIGENSAAKARHVWNNYHYNCFADDSGLIIPSLGGEPGVHSAHYAGPDRNDQANIRKLWKKLGNRSADAYFLTVITLILNGRVSVFEGRVDGKVLPEARGTNGFGYDPVFQPKGSKQTFAEMTLDQKSMISHRAKAFNQLKVYLDQLP